MRYFNFHFESAGDRPILDLSPHHVRMACCYMDKKGFYHVFVDFIHSSLDTIHSWQARIDLYSGTTPYDLVFSGTAVDHGGYDYATDTGDPDCYGAGSPDVIVVDDKIYVFYSGRGSLPHGSKMNGLAKPGEKGFVSADIMYACSPINPGGAPVFPFRKMGVVIKREQDWEAMRLDDPFAIKHEDEIFLYYKGFGNNEDKGKIKLGFAASSQLNLNFVKNPKPILSVPGGLEMPAVFKYKGTWNMFLRHFEKGDGTIWKHYVSRNGISWKLFNDSLFGCAGENPGEGATDMMLVKDFDGQFTGKALATGMENGILKLWLYNIIPVD